MNTLVVYDSQYGNTERIAQAIAGALSAAGPSRAVRVTATDPGQLQGVDLLVLGSPTQGWKPTPAMQSYVERLSPASLSGLQTACFDTRMRMPRFLTGSAAQGMAKVLATEGATPLMPPEAFFVKGREGPLQDGELERAADWARALRERYEAVRAPEAPARA